MTSSSESRLRPGKRQQRRSSRPPSGWRTSTATSPPASARKSHASALRRSGCEGCGRRFYCSFLATGSQTCSARPAAAQQQRAGTGLLTSIKCWPSEGPRNPISQRARTAAGAAVDGGARCLHAAVRTQSQIAEAQGQEPHAAGRTKSFPSEVAGSRLGSSSVPQEAMAVGWLSRP